MDVTDFPFLPAQIHLITQKEGISQQELFKRSLKLYQKEQMEKKAFISQIKSDLLLQLGKK